MPLKIKGGNLSCKFREHCGSCGYGVKKRRKRRNKMHGRGETLNESADKSIIRNDLGENNIKALERLDAGPPGLQAPGNLAQPNFPGSQLRGKSSIFSRAKNYVKKHKIISRGTRAIGHFSGSKAVSALADEIEQAGYGRLIKKKQKGGRALGPTLRDKYLAVVV